MQTCWYIYLFILQITTPATILHHKRTFILWISAATQTTKGRNELQHREGALWVCFPPELEWSHVTNAFKAQRHVVWMYKVLHRLERVNLIWKCSRLTFGRPRRPFDWDDVVFPECGGQMIKRKRSTSGFCDGIYNIKCILQSGSCFQTRRIGRGSTWISSHLWVQRRSLTTEKRTSSSPSQAPAHPIVHKPHTIQIKFI